MFQMIYISNTLQAHIPTDGSSGVPCKRGLHMRNMKPRTGEPVATVYNFGKCAYLLFVKNPTGPLFLTVEF